MENEGERGDTGEHLVWWSSSQRLSEELSSTDFNTWIRPLQVRHYDDRLVVLAPNRWVKEEVERRYWPRILELIASFDVRGRTRHVELAIGGGDLPVGGPLRAGPRTRSEDGSAMEGAGLEGVGLSLDPHSVFETFVVGKSNQFAKNAALGVASACVARAPTERLKNPLLVYGGTGLGKTHLMHAIGNEVLANAPCLKVVYLPARDFGNNIVRGIRNHAVQDAMQIYEAVDLLMIDDIEFLAGKSRFQEELFHIFNTLHSRNKQVVLTSDRYPTDIDGLEARLKSRFIGGLPVELDLPEVETRAAILQSKGKAEGFDITIDVALYIAVRIRSNVRVLGGALERVIESARFADAPVTVDLVKKALRAQFAIQNRHITVEHIQKVVADYYNVRLSDMLGKGRSRFIVRPRHFAMCLAREFTSHSLPEIGERFGGRDHTTVLNACRRVKELRESSNDMAEDYKNLSRRVNED